MEIVKLLLAERAVLVLDEPTRGLAPHEVESLFRVFAGLRADGYAVVFITHRMPEVLACADRITVMRRGRVTGTVPRAEATAAGAGVADVRRGPRRAGGRSRRRRRPPRRRRRRILELRGVAHPGRRPRDRPHRRRPRRAAGRDRRRRRRGRQRAARARRRHPGPRAAAPPASKRLGGEDATRLAGGARPGAPAWRSSPRTRSGWPRWASLTLLENMVLGDTRKYARRGGLALDWARARADLDRLARPPRRDAAAARHARRRALRRQRPAPDPRPRDGPRAAADRGLLSDARPRRAQRGGGAGLPGRAPRRGRGRAADLRGPGRALRAQRPARRAVPRAHRRRGRAGDAHRRGGRLPDDGHPRAG